MPENAFPRPRTPLFNSAPDYFAEDFTCPTCDQPPRDECVITRGPLQGELVGSRMDDEGEVHEPEDVVPHKPRERLRVEAQRAIDAEWGRLKNWWAILTEEQQADLLPLTEGEALPTGYLSGLVDHGVVVAGASWPSSVLAVSDETGIVVNSLLGMFLAQRRKNAGVATRSRHGPDVSDLPGQHSARFRKVATRYPRRVAEAYDGDLARAAADSDEQVATRVAAWEAQHGLTIRDWAATGRVERDEADDG